MSTSAGAPAPVFSYAQAAKGLTPATSTQTTSRNESPAASEKSTKDRLGSDAASNPSIKATKSKPDSDNKQNVDVTSTRPLPASSSKDAGERDELPAGQSSQDNEREVKAMSTGGVSSPSQNSQLDDARPSMCSRRTTSADQFQETGSRDKSVGDKKSKESEDDWEKVSIPSVAAEKELKAAPIPMVNIWKQRQEAQAAKVKEVQDQQRVPSSSPPVQAPKPKVAAEEPKQNASSRDRAVLDKETKNIDSARSGNRKDTPVRTPRPVSQHGDKREAETPPTVGDAQSWPTPENSTADERRKSSSYERVDKPDGKFTVQKSHGKSWVQVPFVPSAKFETQLPPVAARRGGRGGNRGRESGGRGAYSGAATEKQDVSGLMGPPPVPKPAAEQDRGRKSEGQRGPRGASDPSSSARPIGGADSRATFNKQTQPPGKPSGIPSANASNPSANQPGDEPEKAERSSRSSSRHTGRATTRVLNGDTNGGQVEHRGTSVANSEQSGRLDQSFDRFKGSGNTASRGNTDFGRGGATARNRDWSREKPDSAREKVESWRDRDTPSDQNGRREIRSDRGRGSGYRGARGSHSYSSTYTPNHAYTSPLPQNGFEPSRSSSHTENRARQSSQPFPPAQSPSSNRSNPRSQSIPVQMINYPGFYNNAPNMTHGLPFLQTDVGYQQLPMQPGIMTAVPYNDPLNSFALMAMVITQIEYYFSIDNLCKDLFLRKHMDSQGWVPVSVIANFKRIKTLTEDNMTVETVRYVCQTVKGVEFLPGPEGDDRLRRRDNWRDFVLPYEERFESARHEGPILHPEQYNRSSAPEQNLPAEANFVPNHLRSPPPGAAPTNGLFHTSSPMTFVPGGPAEAQAFNGAFVPPPFEEAAADSIHRPSIHSTHSNTSTTIKSPVQNAAPPASYTNGHHRHSSRSDIEANIFPDENIPNINIRMQPRTFLPSGEGEAHQTIARVETMEPTGAQQEPSSPEQIRVPSMRGGAGSPQQLEKLRKISFGFSNGVPTSDENSIIYFTKGGQETQLPPPRPGQYDQTYLSLHDTAFQQKQLGVDGALEPLYSFWTDFLADKFNSGMYQEFKETAQVEAQQGNGAGLGHLNRYYAKLLGGPVPVSERLASDMVALAREEKESERALFQILRGAWRNGATNLKTIKRLGSEFTVEEKKQLDKSG